MKRIMFFTYLIAISLNSFAFNFMGLEIKGDVEHVADSLATKGFTRKIGIVQTGSDKGKQEVMKTDDSLFLEGKYENEDALLILRFPKKDNIVSELYLSIEKSSFSEIAALWMIIGINLEEKYGKPDINADLRNIPNASSRLIKQWQFKDIIICLDVAKDKNELLLSIAPN